MPAWLSNVDGAVWAVLAFAGACVAALLIAVVTETRLPDATPSLDEYARGELMREVKGGEPSC